MNRGNSGLLMTEEERTINEAAMHYMIAKLELINSDLSAEMDRKIASNIIGRIKDAKSIENKLIRKNLAITRENVKNRISDIIGVRAICFFVDDLYRFQERLKNHNDITIIKVKDYIEQPKKSGYRSLHLICMLEIPFGDRMENITVEIQLRTNAMDYWAELDNQLHYKKKENEKSEQIEQQLKLYAEKIDAIDRKMMKLRNKISKLQAI